jgi:hypothetical protein
LVRSLLSHLALALVINLNTTFVRTTGIFAQLFFVSKLTAEAPQPLMHLLYKTLLHIRPPYLAVHLSALAPKTKKTTPATPDTMASPKVGGSPIASTIAPTSNMMPSICRMNPAGFVGFDMAYFLSFVPTLLLRLLKTGCDALTSPVCQFPA